jgi:uncharacterized protein CbrC (UPF0167 family)
MILTLFSGGGDFHISSVDKMALMPHYQMKVGKSVDESFDGEVLQEVIERTGRSHGFVEKAMMRRCGDVLDAFFHYSSASR